MCFHGYKWHRHDWNPQPHKSCSESYVTCIIHMPNSTILTFTYEFINTIDASMSKIYICICNINFPVIELSNIDRLDTLILKFPDLIFESL